jgi:hypothetical protein
MLSAAMCMLMGAVAAEAQDPASAGQGTGTSDQTHWYSPSRYKKLNPVPYVKKPIDYLRSDSKTASEQLAANSEEDKKLTAELQASGLLPASADAKDACSEFKSLEDCVAALHASRSVGVKFECLKWTITTTKPEAGAQSCAEPDYGRPMTLERAIHALKPDVDAKYEAKNAVRRARENIADARS